MLNMLEIFENLKVTVLISVMRNADLPRDFGEHLQARKNEKC